MIDSEIKLRIVGCGDAFGSGGRLNTCFYIEATDTRMLIDCGATSLPGLKKHDILSEEIDTILITHFHGDHYGGLPFFLLDAAIHKRQNKLKIISPPGAEERVRGLLTLLYPGTEVLEKLDVEFLEYFENKTFHEKHFSITPYSVVHSEETLPHGLRIELEGKIISYSGDTSWTDNLIPLSADADLFICECNFYNTLAKGHIAYSELESQLSHLTHKRLLLTHFDDEMLNALDLIPHACAYDGMQIIL
ncbi:MAG: MBL fold metallo-hydrolase [Pedobacter sp.]|nr:MAG: MBL fold metallo-hydrolase [Pedobacter sp.]